MGKQKPKKVILRFCGTLLSTNENGAPFPLLSTWKGALGPVVEAQAPLISIYILIKIHLSINIEKNLFFTVGH